MHLYKNKLLLFSFEYTVQNDQTQPSAAPNAREMCVSDLEGLYISCKMLACR